MITRYFILPLIFLISCGNPAIVRYLEPENPVIRETRIKTQNTYNYEYKIFDKNDLTVYLKNATYKDIEQLSKLDISSEISFRIPALTYLEFIVENNSNNNISINFFNSILTDSENNPVKIFSQQDFIRDYTSVAYRHFHYDKIFSFYVTRYQNKTPKKVFFYDKFSPDTMATIKPGYSGLQIVPFKKISERTLNFTIEIEIPDFQEKITVPLKFVIRRSDRP